MDAWAAAGGRWGVGSDSRVTVDAADELRILEYSQRLASGRRNVMATAAGRSIRGLDVGQRADLVVLDGSHPILDGLAPEFRRARERDGGPTWI
jgi:formimidoylglutamate deiminase